MPTLRTCTLTATDATGAVELSTWTKSPNAGGVPGQDADYLDDLVLNGTMTNGPLATSADPMPYVRNVSCDDDYGSQGEGPWEIFPAAIAITIAGNLSLDGDNVLATDSGGIATVTVGGDIVLRGNASISHIKCGGILDAGGTSVSSYILVMNATTRHSRFSGSATNDACSFWGACDYDGTPVITHNNGYSDCPLWTVLAGAIVTFPDAVDAAAIIGPIDNYGRINCDGLSQSTGNVRLKTATASIYGAASIGTGVVPVATAVQLHAAGNGLADYGVLTGCVDSAGAFHASGVIEADASYESLASTASSPYVAGEAAGEVAGASTQLATDQAAVTAVAGSLLDTETLLTVDGALDSDKVMVSAGGNLDPKFVAAQAPNAGGSLVALGVMVGASTLSL